MLLAELVSASEQVAATAARGRRSPLWPPSVADPPLVPEQYAVTDPEHACVRRIFVMSGASAIVWDAGRPHAGSPSRVRDHGVITNSTSPDVTGLGVDLSDALMIEMEV